MPVRASGGVVYGATEWNGWELAALRGERYTGADGPPHKCYTTSHPLQQILCPPDRLLHGRRQGRRQVVHQVPEQAEKKQFGKAAMSGQRRLPQLWARAAIPRRGRDFVRLIFLSPYSTFLNPAEWPWRSGKAEMRSTFRRPARSYFRKIMSVYGSLEIKFEPRNILFRSLNKILTL